LGGGGGWLRYGIAAASPLTACGIYCDIGVRSFTETQILDTIFRYPNVVAWLYEQFAALHKPGGTG